MTTGATATTGGMRATAPARPSTSGSARPETSTTAAPSGRAAAPRTAGAAAVVDLSPAARQQLAGRPAGSAATTDAGSPFRLESFDEMVQSRTDALAAKLADRLTRLGVPQDEPITLQLDSLGQVKTDSPYKERIEKLFREDPELAKAFKDVASLNAMKAAQKALEALDAEKKAARNDDARDAAQGRYAARLMTSQALSGTMTLNDGALHSASVAFMDKSVGDAAPAQASRKAVQAAAARVSLTA